jgi:hypothetical protein
LQPSSTPPTHLATTSHFPTDRDARSLQEQDQGGEAGSSGRGGGAAAAGAGGVDWAQYPEAAAAVVIYHELIMKIKHILLVYIKMRADVICDMRWEQRRSAKDLSVMQEKKVGAAGGRAGGGVCFVYVRGC